MGLPYLISQAKAPLQPPCNEILLRIMRLHIAKEKNVSGIGQMSIFLTGVVVLYLMGKIEYRIQETGV